MDDASQVPAATDDADFGVRFLDRYRQAAKGCAWSYETIQEIKRSSREDLLTLFRGRGLSYQGLQQLRASTPEEFAEWLVAEHDRESLILSGLLS